MSQPHVLLAGGGTGGHLFPGLAVAEKLAQRTLDLRMTFVGTGRRWEREEVELMGFTYQSLPSRPLLKHPWHALRFFTDNLAGYCAARWLLREQQVSVVVGLGGYASAAVSRAAVDRGIPVVLLEQNVIAGRATRWLAPSTTLVCSAFPQVRRQLNDTVKFRVTGNPVRGGITRLHETGGWLRQSEIKERKKQLVILGGSRGSQALNRQVPGAIHRVGRRMKGWQIVHQAGADQVCLTEDRYRRLGLEAIVVSYLDDMRVVLGSADLVISRAGGTSIAELALGAVPSILVPYPAATLDHQAKNAAVLQEAGACRMVDEQKSSGFTDRLARELSQLVYDDNLRRTLARNMRTFARPEAAGTVAEAIVRLTGALPGELAA